MFLHIKDAIAFTNENIHFFRAFVNYLKRKKFTREHELFSY